MVIALVEFENVLARPIGIEGPLSTDIQVRRADDLDVWVKVVVEGFAHPDGEGQVSHEHFPADIIERAERDMEKPGQHRLSRSATATSPAAG